MASGEIIVRLRRRTKWIWRAAFVWTFVIGEVFAQTKTGVAFLRNYPPQEYHAAPQNWAVTQAPNGVMFFGNNEGVLEYDGANWRVLRTQNQTTLRSLAVTPEGVIFLGARGELGYLVPNETGRLEVRSLLNFLPENNRDFSDVWTAFAIGDAVYFQTEKYIFRFRKATSSAPEVKVWTAQDRFHLLFRVGKDLYVRHWSVGLQKLNEKDEWQTVPGGEQLADERVYSVLPYDAKRLVVATRTRGLLLYDGQKFSPFAQKLKETFNAARIYCGLLLPDSSFAYGTAMRGVFIVDKNGRVKKNIDEIDGLYDNEVFGLFIDREYGLWTVLNNGISRVEALSPLTVINTGLEGSVQSVMRHKDRLYVATTQGVFSANAKGEDESPRFSSVKGIANQCWKLKEIKGRLLLGARDGLYAIDGETCKPIFKTDQAVFDILISKKHSEEILYLATGTGLQTLIWKKNEWKPGAKVKNLNEDLRSLAEASDGTLWVGTSYLGVKRIDFTSEVTENVAVRSYGQNSGLPALNENYVVMLDGLPTFSCRDGLYYYDVQTDKILKDKRFDISGRDLAEFRILNADRPNQSWLLAKNRVTKQYETFRLSARPDGKKAAEAAPYLKAGRFIAQELYVEPDGTIWLGTSEGVARYRPSKSKTVRPAFQALIRRVTIDEDSVLFDGYGARKPTLAHGFKTLHFEFAAPHFEESDAVEYRYSLKGYDENWAKWAPSGARDYTNLPEGEYVMQVEARNHYGEISPAATFSFVVLPPWYRTYWAYFCYLAVGATAVWAAFRWRLQRIKSENLELESRILDRTREIERRSAEIEAANEAVQKQKQELEVAYREISAKNDIMERVNTALQLQTVELETLYDEIAAKNEEMETANALLQDQKNEIEKAYSEVNQKQEEVRRAYDEIAAKNSLMEAANLEIARKNAELSQINAAVMLREEELKATLEELQATQGQLVMSEKMAVLGQLMAGVAHEINTPIGAIHASVENAARAFPQMLQKMADFYKVMTPEMEPYFHRLIERTLAGAQILTTREEREYRRKIADELTALGLKDVGELSRELAKFGLIENLDELLPVFEHKDAPTLIQMAHIIGRIRLNFDNITIAVAKTQKIIFALKSYSFKETTDEVTETNIVENIQTVITIYHNMLKSGIELKTNIEENLPEVFAYGDELTQVWTNLIFNGVQAMRGVGNLEIEIKKEAETESEGASESIVVHITDNGPGVPPDIQDKIFDAFFTTKAKGEGTGLGLDICRKIIAKHFGALTFQSAPGRTTFTVRLPILPFKAYEKNRR